MAASDTTITLPNPYTPMAFIPPEFETKTMGLTYAIVGSLAVGGAWFSSTSSSLLIALCATVGSHVGYHPPSPPGL